MSYYNSLYSILLYGSYIISNAIMINNYKSYSYFFCTSLLYFTLQYEIYNTSENQKNLYLVRGLPGCGKTEYIDNKFKNQSIDLFENYDLKKQNFENLYIEKERNFIELFKCIYNNNSKIIVVSGFFPNTQSISNIKYLCNEFNYNLKIISFDDITDKNEMKYLLNNSSIKNFNKSFIFKNFENYKGTLLDYDSYDSLVSEIFVSNYNDCVGDSFHDDCITKKQLDIELEEISN